jgi:hypothetical protein
MSFKHRPRLTAFYLENESPDMRKRRERYEKLVTALRKVPPDSPAEKALVAAAQRVARYRPRADS